MNATMIKGERSKLLAVVAIMAMVLCAFAVVLPAEEANAVGIDSTDDVVTVYGSDGTTELVTLTFKEALYVLSYSDTQTYFTDVTLGDGVTVDSLTGDGQIWQFAAGDYDVTGTTTNVNYPGWQVSKFVINADSIVITAAADAAVTFYGTNFGSAMQSPNLDLNQGDTIAVYGDNVTIQNVTVMPSFQGQNDANKAIEIYGDDVTISNVTLTANNKAANNSSTYGGSIYINSPEGVAQDVTIENTKVYNGLVTFSGANDDTTVKMTNVDITSTDDNGKGINNAAKVGSLTAEDVVIDITGDVTFGQDYNITIPAGVTVNIAEGASVTVTEGGSFSPQTGSTVNNNGSILDFQSGRAEVDNYSDLATAASSALVDEIVLTASIEATGNVGAVAASIDLNGFDLDMGTHTLNVYAAGENGLIVPAGSTLTLGGVVKVTEDGLSTVARSNIVYEGNGYFAHTGSTAESEITAAEFTPDFTDGTSVTKPVGQNIRTYTIYHFMSDYGDIQYGASINGLSFNDSPYRDSSTFFTISTMDDEWTANFDYTLYMTSDNLDAITGEKTKNPWDSLTAARTYEDAIRAYVQFTPDPNSTELVGAEPVSTWLYFDVVIDPAESEATFANSAFKMTTSADGNTITVTEGKAIVGDDGKYYVTFDMTGQKWVSGVKTPMSVDEISESIIVNGDYDNGKITLCLGDSLTDIKDIVVTFTVDGSGNYAATDYTFKFSGITADLTATVDVITQDEYTAWGYKEALGVELGDMASGITFSEPELQTDGTYVIDVAGTLPYMTEFPWFVGNNDIDSNGWYLPFKVTLPSGFTWADATLRITNNTSNATEKPFGPLEDSEADTYPQFSKIGVSGTDTIKVIVDFTDGAYNDLTYTLDLSDVNYGTYTGYIPTVESYVPGVSGSTVDLGGITKTDVPPKTMFLISNPIADNTEDLQYALYYGDHYTKEQITGEGAPSVIYTQKFTDSASDEIWYFSLNEYEGVYNYLNSLAEKPDYTLGALGAYTMVLYYIDDDGVMQIVDIDYADIAGTIGAGYDELAADAISGMADCDYTVTDVADDTMWIVWYNALQYDGDVIANLYYNGSETPIYTETIGSWNTEGRHGWYFSFVEGEPSYSTSETVLDPLEIGDFKPGEYLMKVTTIVDEKRVILAEATVVIPGTVEDNAGYSESIEGAYNGITGVGGTVNGTIDEDAGKYGDLVENVGWLVWYGENYENVTATLTWNGITIFVETDADVPNWLNAGTHTWYFSLKAGEQVMTYVTDKGIQYTSCAPGTYVMEITVNGSDEPIATGEFTIREEGTYHVNYIDEDWPYADGGYNETVILEDGNYVTLPALPDTSKDAYGWLVQGTENNVVYPAGALVDVSKYTDVLGNVTFIALYVTDYRTDYRIDIDEGEVLVDNGVLTVPIVSDLQNVYADGDSVIYRNLTANHYFVITYSNADGTSGTVVIPSKINNGGFVSADTLVYEIPGFGEGSSVTVEFVCDYADGFTFGPDCSYRYYDTPEPTSQAGFGATSEDAYNGIIAAGGSVNGVDAEHPTGDVSPMTAFVVFETNAELNGQELTATVYDESGVAVYTEKMTFQTAGTHVFYFTFAEGYENSNKQCGENGDISEYYVSGADYYVYITGATGTIVNETITA